MKRDNEYGRRLEGGMVGHSLTRALPDRAFLLKERKLRSTFSSPMAQKNAQQQKRDKRITFRQ